MAFNVTNIADPVAGGGIVEDTNLQSKVTPVTGAFQVVYLKIDNSANGAEQCFLHIWDLANVSVTEGTTATDHTIHVKPGKVMTLYFREDEMEFATALTWAVATTHTGTTRPASAVVVEAIYET